jgi:D-amino-acid oxidase
MSAPDAVVVGAGIIGITTAIRLADAGLDVTILAADEPGDTTSVLATAMVGPSFGMLGSRGTHWETQTVAAVLAEENAPGVHVCRGRFIARPAGLLPPGADSLPGFELCTDDETPPGYGTAFWARVPLIDMTRYLPFLVERAAGMGIAMQRRRLESLSEASEIAPRVANCSGLGARELVPDPEVTPLRGPKIVVANPGIDTFLIEGPPGPEGTSYHPHGDVVVLGGSAKPSSDTTPDLTEERAIIARCATIEPRLADPTVIEHRVGLRPSRADIRLEAERSGSATFVHNYGHGGMGVSLAWGCAAEATRLLLQ